MEIQTLKTGENTITILVYNEETKKNSTYQITVQKQAAENTQIDDGVNNAIKKANKVRHILLGVVIFIIVCIIIFIIVRHKLNQEDINDDAYDYDSEDKERLNLDGEEELFSRVNKERFERKVNNDNSDILLKNNEEEVDNEQEIEEFPIKQDITREEIQNKENDEKPKEFFRTSKSKPKGKHF